MSLIRKRGEGLAFGNRRWVGDCLAVGFLQYLIIVKRLLEQRIVMKFVKIICTREEGIKLTWQ